jgi:phosphate transport system substrate-binding protein
LNLKKWLALALMAVVAVALVGCGAGGTSEGDGGSGDTGGGSDLTGSITIQGSDTMVNLSQAWAETFMDEYPGVTISVTGGGSGTGIASIINGTVDFANASREMKDEEVEQAAAAGAEPVEHTVARDGIAVFVHPDNPVEELTLEQLGQIYRGEVTNWSEVGGSDKPIVLLGRDTSSGTYEYFKEEVVGNDFEYAAAMKNLQSSQGIVDEVSKNLDAIGYSGVGYIADSIEVVKIDGTAASIEAVLAGDYVLSRGLYMYSNGDVEGVQKAFLDWILAADGQAIVGEEGFVPVNQ